MDGIQNQNPPYFKIHFKNIHPLTSGIVAPPLLIM